MGLKEWAAIGDGLSQLKQLSALNLTIGENNYLGSEGSKAIGDGLSALKQISTLNLTIGHKNNLGPEGGKAIGNCVS